MPLFVEPLHIAMLREPALPEMHQVVDEKSKPRELLIVQVPGLLQRLLPKLLADRKRREVPVEIHDLRGGYIDADGKHHPQANRID